MRKSNTTPLKIESKFILLIAMLYVTISLTADVIAFRFVSFFGLLESSATIIFPLSYLIGDVTCEVYGWDVAMKMVWLMLLCEGLFAILITVILKMPAYGIGHYQNEYRNIFGNLWLFVLSGIIANSLTSLLNIYFISKWKIITKGKYFWARSILSTCITEFVLVLITAGMSFTSFIHAKNTLHVGIDAYLLEVIYAFVFVVPAQLIVDFLKKVERIDAYDYGKSYNPFKFA